MNLLHAALAIPFLLAAPAALAETRTLSLDDALHEVDAQSLTLAQARARVEEAAGLSRQALAAALPTLTAAAGYARNSDAAQVTPPSLPGQASARTIVIQPEEVLGASGTVRVPLVAPVAWAEAAAARSLQRSASASADAVRLQVRTALIQSAWTAAAGEDIVAASERALTSADEQARSAQRAVEAGTGVPLAVMQARTETVKRRSELVRARADLERARLAVGVLLGRAAPVQIPMPAIQPPGPIDARALAEEAQSHRPEMVAAEAQIEGAERQLTAARLRWLPQLSASASAFAQDVVLPTGKKDGWRVTLDLVWQLYDGGARYGRARQARGAAKGARAAEEAQRLAIDQEVEDAARDVAVAAERLALAGEQARLAEEAAATARRGFAGGVASSLDVLDANDRLYQSEVGVAEARARLGVARASLDRAAGRS